MTTKAGDLRDDACGDGRAGGDGSFKIDAAVGYTFGIDDGSGLGGAGAQVGGANEELPLTPYTFFSNHVVDSKLFQATLSSS